MSHVQTLEPLTPEASADAAGGPAAAPVSLERVAALLRGLNREQRRAVVHGEGAQLVLAGPGTGKTEVVTRRIAWLIATKRARPREILALTFTDKAATEMQARVDVLVPYGQADAQIQTFHAFGDRLLRDHAFELGMPTDIRLLSRREAVVLLRENLFSLGLERYRPLGDPTRFLGALVDLFQRAKEEGITPAAFSAHAAELADTAAGAAPGDRHALTDLAAARAELAGAYVRYSALLGERGLIDHGDQVALAVRLLAERPHVRREVGERYRYVLVDEFQDTNPSQLELVLSVAARHGNVTAVGDDDQAIYAFRGAALSNMGRFGTTYPGLQRVVLRRNYRSRAPIVDAARRLISHNDPGRLAGRFGAAVEQVAHRRGRRAEPVRQLSYRTAENEADGVAEVIAGRVSAGEKPRRFCVLVRTNTEVDAFVRSLLVRGVPARSGAPADLYAQPQVRSLVAFLRVVADPDASMELYALATADPYGLGGGELTGILREARRRHRTLWQVLCELVDNQSTGPTIGADIRRRAARLVSDLRAAIELSHERSAGEVLYDHLRRSGRLSRLAADGDGEGAVALQAIGRFFEIVRREARLLAEDRVAFLAPHLATLAEAGTEPVDAGPDAEDAVAVLTVHRAKGLEFDVVFVCGLADGRFPSRGRPPVLALPDELRAVPAEQASEDPLAEERRLFYVAMTRARDELWLSRSSEIGAGRGIRRPSPFIAEALDQPPLAVVGSPEDTDRIALAARTARPAAPGIPAGPTTGRLSLSFSQLEDYLGCPERYRLRHVIGVPTPPHHALAYGSALHAAVAAFHLAQARGHVMSEEELLSAFAASWSSEGFLSRAHEEARYAYGRAALRKFRDDQVATGAPPPVAVEKRFGFELGQDEIRGRIDRLDESAAGVVITDYKSSDVRDQRKADEKARDSLQLQVYALAHVAETGQLPDAVQLHFLDSGVVGRARVDEARLARTQVKITAAADGIRAGAFPAQPNPIGCGYCPYREICASSAA